MLVSYNKSVLNRKIAEGMFFFKTKNITDLQVFCPTEMTKNYNPFLPMLYICYKFLNVVYCSEVLPLVSSIVEIH